MDDSGTDPTFEGLQEDTCKDKKSSEREERRSCWRSFLSAKKERVCIVILFLFILVLIICIIIITKGSPVKESQQQCPAVDRRAFCGPACPSGWIGYEGKCYFFSDEGRNWTSGQSFCTSYNSSLAVIESETEKAFINRYKCSVDYWIGLRKDPDHSWKWTDGTELNSMLEVKGGGGDCASLNSGFAVSSRCYIQRNWICSHHNAYAHNKSSSIRR